MKSTTLAQQTKREKRRVRKQQQGVSALIPKRDYLLTSVAGIAPEMKVTLAFEFTGNSTISATTFSSIATVLLNTAFQPASTSTPTGSAKWFTFYNQAFVMASRMNLQMVNTTATNPVVLGVTFSTSSSAPANMGAAVTQGLCKHQLVYVNPDRFAASVAIDVSKFLDKPIILDDPTLASFAGSNPSSLVYAHIWVGNIGNTNASVSYILDMEMDTIYVDPLPFS